MKVTRFLNFDDMLHRRAGSCLASLDSMLMLQIQTKCTLPMHVRISSEVNLQINCSNLQLRSKAESCEEVQNKFKDLEKVQNKTTKSKSDQAEFT